MLPCFPDKKYNKQIFMSKVVVDKWHIIYMNTVLLNIVTVSGWDKYSTNNFVQAHEPLIG